MSGVARPRLILLFSGKRKSGKDYVTERVRDRLGPEVCAILRLSEPLKAQYAREHNLDFGRLLDPSGYKEKYRSDMIQWGEEKRKYDPGFFCRIIVEGVTQPVWIVSDARRRSDVDWFRVSYGGLMQMLRVQASEATRQQRGWVFTPGVDDAESECDLDKGVDFDWIIPNDGGTEILDAQLDSLVDFIRARLTAHIT